MKKLRILWMALMAIGLIGFYSCSEDAENEAPAFESVTVADNNKTVTVTFTEEVYANNDKTGNITADGLSVMIENVDFTYEVTHTAGTKTLTIDLMITSVTDGTEIITIKPAGAESIYDADGMAMEATGSISSDPIASDQGIIGEWYSSGDNVAPLLVTYFEVDSIYAKFNDDFTYYVEQFNEGNDTETPDLIFSGSYTIEKSEVGEIWTIDITQEVPFAANSEGIFEVKTNPEVLWYEVVQTSGTQNVPPTPEDGFGSSNGGSLGETNIQKYIRLN